MCDGTYRYPIKGITAIKMNKPLVIVCSNMSIEEAYPNKYEFVKARFREFNISN